MTLRDNRFVATEVFTLVDEENVAFSTMLPVDDHPVMSRNSFVVVFYDIGETEEANRIVEDRYDEVIATLAQLPPDWRVELEHIGASEEEPRSKAALLNSKGRNYCENGNYMAAIWCYTEAANLDPLSATDYIYNRGNAHMDAGDITSAFEDFSFVIDRNPLDADAYLNRGLAKKLLGDYQGAKTDYEMVLRLFVQGVDSRDGYGVEDALVNLGNIALLIGNLGTALRYFDRAIELAPGAYSAYYNRAMLHLQNHHYVAAVRDLEQYLKLGGGQIDGDQIKVEQTIAQLKLKISESS